MKEAVKTIVIVILVAVSVYFAMKFDQVNSQMQVLGSADSLQTIQVDNFNHNLNDLRLEFIGRGHHIQEFQAALKNANERIDNTNYKLDKKVDSVGVIILELTNTVENNFDRVNSKLDDLGERITDNQRSTNRKFTDIQQTLAKVSREISNIKKDVKNLEENKMDKPEEEEQSGRRR